MISGLVRVSAGSGRWLRNLCRQYQKAQNAENNGNARIMVMLGIYRRPAVEPSPASSGHPLTVPLQGI